MPIYEYECGDCGACFEKLVGVNDGRVNCATCGSPHTRKKISRVAAPTPSPARTGQYSNHKYG